MIAREELTAVEVAQGADEMEAFYEEHDISSGDLVAVAYEIAGVRMMDLQEGAVLSSEVLGVTLASMYLLGFETAIRVHENIE